MMYDPIVFGYPLTTLFLLFLIYSFLGWAMETTYCSVLRGKFVMRGFLMGPVCPIYGVGCLLMLLFLQKLTFNPVLFYVTSTIVMSVWEYFVGALLLKTTGIRYWDYSDKRFNLNGHICLQNCIWWGILCYLVLYVIEPIVAYFLDTIPYNIRYGIACVLALVLLFDAVYTIRRLALMTKMLKRMAQLSGELAVQLELAKLDLGDRVEFAKMESELRRRTVKKALDAKLKEAREAMAETADALQEKHTQALENSAQRVRKAYDDYMAAQEFAEHYAHHFLVTYDRMISESTTRHLKELQRESEKIRARYKKRKAALKEQKKQ